MAIIEGEYVRTCDGIILWDGITQPNTDTADGSVQHSLKIAIPQNAQEVAEITQIATDQLNKSQHFHGKFPPGGEWPVREFDPSTFGDSAPTLQGRYAINAKTRRGAPAVYSSDGQELSAMQYGQMLYPGAIVQMLVHAYDFNNKSKGIALGLDGIMIVDATAPKLDVGGGLPSSQVAAAFGVSGNGQATAAAAPPTAGPATAAAAAPPQPGNVEPNHQFVQNAAQSGGAPAPAPSPTPAPPPAAPSGPRMTDKAGGVTYDQFIAAGWTDDMMVEHGYMTR